jgi:hypothetical protein
MIKKAYPSGLKYLCYTKQEPYAYKGSGLRWENHIRYHNSHIITSIIGEYETMEEIRENGIKWSRELDVVASEEWANLREEDGLGGGSGKVGRRWKIKDTSRMVNVKTRTQAVVDGYQKNSVEGNYQFKGWYVTPWGKFAALRDAVKKAKELKASGSDSFIVTDSATIRRYCIEADKPLSYAIRIPKERQGKKPSEFGFTFIQKEQNDNK